MAMPCSLLSGDLQAPKTPFLLALNSATTCRRALYDPRSSSPPVPDMGVSEKAPAYSLSWELGDTSYAVLQISQWE